MQSLETTCDEGDNSIKRYKTSQPQLSQLHSQEQFTSVTASPQEITENPSGKPPIDIFEKLLELHKEECCEKEKKTKEEEENVFENIKYYSLLLEKLVAKERLNTLILNLYPGNKGYSLAFRTVSRSDPNYTEDTANMIETKPWPYEEDDLLRYVDNEELPPFILDLLEPQFSYLFYNGCIIAEVKDYRQAYPHFKCDSHHVLLKPTQRSVMADIHNIMEEKPEWSNEEKEQLESQLLMANAPGLCLDPDNTIGEEVTEVYNRRKMWNTYKFRRMAKKFSQVTVNRKRKLDQFTYRPGLEFYEFLTRSRNKTKSSANSASRTAGTNIKKDIPVPNLDSPVLTPPQEIIINEFKPYQRPKETNDCMPQLIEEYILETDMPSKEKGSPRVYHIKLSILQRPSDSEYLGELYLDRDHKKNEHNGVACMFSLGSRMNANRYIHQFTEIFTESGRKSVRISYRLSPGYKERIAQAQAQVQLQCQNSIQNTNLPQQHLQQLTAAVAMNGTVVNSLHTQNQEASNVTILKSHLQGSAKPSTQELAISALATKLMNSAQQFQAESAKKEQQQPQQLSSQHQLQEPPQQQSRLSGNTAILNLLNSSPASNINTDAVVNAINNSQLLPQLQAVNQKIVSRKMTLPNVANARVLSHNNLIALNSSRLNLQDLGQQTITLASVNSNNISNLTTVPIKQQLANQRLIGNNSGDNKSALSALLVGTPAADRPDIIGPNTNSLLLEKLGPNSVQQTHYIQSSKPNQQFMVQSPKGNSVLNSISSPPPQTSGTINVQGLNIAQLHGIPGIQVQLPGFSQPISLSLNVSSAGNIQAHPANLIVSLPTTTTQTSNSVTQAAVSSNVSGVNSVSVNPQTVMLANTSNTNLAQLVTSGVKAVTSQGIRTSSPSQTVSIAQSGQSFQLITPLQRSRTQQATVQQQQTLTAKALQRTPITIKMASPSPNQLNDLQLNFDN